VGGPVRFGDVVAQGAIGEDHGPEGAELCYGCIIHRSHCRTSKSSGSEIGVFRHLRPAEVRPLHLRPVEDRPLHLRPAEVRPLHLRPVEDRPLHLRPAEVRPLHLRPAEVRPLHLRPVEDRPLHLRPAEARPLHLRPVEDRPLHLCVEEVCPLHLRPVEDRPLHLRPAEVRPLHLRPAEVRPLHLRPVEDRPLHLRFVETCSAKVEAGQIVALQIGVSKIVAIGAKRNHGVAKSPSFFAERVHLYPPDLVGRAGVGVRPGRRGGKRRIEDAGRVAVGVRPCAFAAFLCFGAAAQHLQRRLDVGAGFWKQLVKAFKRFAQFFPVRLCRFLRGVLGKLRRFERDGTFCRGVFADIGTEDFHDLDVEAEVFPRDAAKGEDGTDADLHVGNGDGDVRPIGGLGFAVEDRALRECEAFVLPLEFRQPAPVAFVADAAPDAVHLLLRAEARHGGIYAVGDEALFGSPRVPLVLAGADDGEGQRDDRAQGTG
jgi:hypothetical protein